MISACGLKRASKQAQRLKWMVESCGLQAAPEPASAKIDFISLMARGSPMFSERPAACTFSLKFGHPNRGHTRCMRLLLVETQLIEVVMTLLSHRCSL